MSISQDVGDTFTVGAGFTVTETAVEVTETEALALSVTCSSKLQTPVIVELEAAKKWLNEVAPLIDE
jgi:hypothetical protein